MVSATAVKLIILYEHIRFSMSALKFLFLASLLRTFHSMTMSIKGKSSRFSNTPKVVSSDPWKVLVTKLSTEKSRTGASKVKSTQGVMVDELKCRHFETCSGCSMRGNFTEAPIVKRARLFFKAEDVEFPIRLGNHSEWRTHAKLAVQPLSRWGGLKIGLYKENTHEVEAITDCKVHHPRINTAVEELKRAAMDIVVKGFQPAVNGRPAEGDLRYVQMTVERRSGKIQLVLVWNVLTFKDAEPILPRLVKRLKGRPDLWHSIFVNFQTSESNAILNYKENAWKQLWGPPVLQEEIGRAIYYFKPQIFRQVHNFGFD